MCARERSGSLSLSLSLHSLEEDEKKVKSVWINCLTDTKLTKSPTIARRTVSQSASQLIDLKVAKKNK